jgi:hypothetical protein
MLTRVLTRISQRPVEPASARFSLPVPVPDTTVTGLPRVLQSDRGPAEVLGKSNHASRVFSATLPRAPAAAVRGRELR